MRHTPAGLPLLRMQVSHASTQQEAGGERKVNCVVEAVAIGDIANRMNGVPTGASVSIEGFLGNKYRTGAQLVLHITTIEIKT